MSNPNPRPPQGFRTKAIHGVRFKKDVHGALRMPVYDSVSFEQESAKDLQLAFEGKKPGHTYSRISNPTVEDLEQKMRLLSGGIACLATASGMAAISNVVMTLCEAGTNLVTSKHLFGNTVSLFEHSLKPWGLEVRYADMTKPEEVAAQIDGKTRLVFCEIITNPQLEVADVKALAAATKAKGVPLVLDGTMTTPYAFPSKQFGVDVEILSSTKYISGGATSVGGLIIDNGNFDWKNSPKLAEKAKKIGPMALIATLRMEVFRNLGACLSPHNAFLQALGLETLDLRINASFANCLALAQHLSQHPKVNKVNYPGLSDNPYHAVALQQFGGKGFGGLLTFELADREACFALVDRLQLVKRCTNINDNKTVSMIPVSGIAFAVGSIIIRKSNCSGSQQ